VELEPCPVSLPTVETAEETKYSSSGGREVATGVSGEKDKVRDRRPVKI
jgi:hypothetical protein